MSNFFETLLLLERLHRMILYKATGKPCILAGKLHISERQVRRLIAELRGHGLPIAYCRHRETYIYTDSVQLQFLLTAGDKALLQIKGGSAGNFF